MGLDDNVYQRLLRERHQRERAAFAVIVGPQHEDDVLDGHDDRQRPEDQRDEADDLGARQYPVFHDGAQRLAKRIDRAGSDIPVDDADRSDGQRKEGTLVVMRLGRQRAARRVLGLGQDGLV